MWKILVAFELLLAFTLLFWWIRSESIIHSMLYKAYASIEEASKRRIDDNKRNVHLLKRSKGRLYRLEQQLLFSGLLKRFPFLTPELYIALNLVVVMAVYLLAGVLTSGWWQGIVAVVIFELAVYLVLNLMIMKQFNATDESLLKFLDFLGNYSITSGEITSVLSQVSEYLEEPLKSTLEECYYEAQMSGDAGIALLSMEAKLQHPKFKELVRNLEITMRYSADFTVLVAQSRRSVRDYMRMRRERKALASEAWVNIVILAAMTVVILKAVEALIGIPIEQILWESWVGKGCMAGIGFLLFLFYRQIKAIDK